MRLPQPLREFGAKLSPRQRQWAVAIGLTASVIGALWAVFAATEQPPRIGANPKAAAAKVTNVDVMAGGAQVTPLDQWIGDAGKKMALYERDKQEQEKRNKDNATFQEQVLKRFSAVDEQLRAQSSAAAQNAPVPAAPAPQTSLPPASALSNTGQLPPPPPPGGATAGLPAGLPPAPMADAARAHLVRITVSERSKPAQQAANPATSAGKRPDGDIATANVDTYLPVSFTRGIMLGGLDAPTGGQAQSNPHPILIRLDDNAVLPNRFRSNVRECFVVAAGYGDIASERAYLRTENLSCVRNDGTTLEVKIQGSVYGEDGLVGIRGRLVTKQGQMLANALLAGLLSGFGQGLSTYNTTTSTSAFGSVSTTEGGQAFRQGLGSGVGRAFERLANYYIKLAESTFPVIEVGAGRAVDVVITKGVRIEGGDLAKAEAAAASSMDRGDPALVRTGGDDEY